jgi:hypothetical protein
MHLLSEREFAEAEGESGVFFADRFLADRFSATRFSAIRFLACL